MNYYGGKGTAIHRTKPSVPYLFWKDNNLLLGTVLDFGSGLDIHDLKRYDPYHTPNLAPLKGHYDTITCNYVLNVQPEEHLIHLTLLAIRSLLKPNGKLLVAVRNDLKASHISTRGHQVHKTQDQWRTILASYYKVKTLNHLGFHGFMCSKSQW